MPVAVMGSAEKPEVVGVRAAAERLGPDVIDLQ